MKKYTKNIRILIGAIIILLSFSGCNSNQNHDTNTVSKIITYVPNCHNGDAKFWKDKIITNVNGILTLYNLDGNVFKFYDDYNLINWTFISTPISCLNNLENVDFFYLENKFYLCYEKEQLDKGLSSICVIASTDQEGTKWYPPRELLPADSDHEPADIIKSPENGFKIYYSCDKDNIGSSYMGAKIYYASFDKNFNLLEKDIHIATSTEKGILLYDICKIKDAERFLYAKNYLSDCDMVVEENS